MDIETMSPRTGRSMKEDNTTINEADKMEEVMGGKGAEFISNANEHTPGEGLVFVALQVISTAVLSAYSPAYTGNQFTGVEIPTGTIIFGRFTSVTLTSGKVLAYKGV